jgi:hypothetical protein
MTTFSKKLCNENWNGQSDYDFQAFFFVLMATALGSIALWQSPQLLGGGFAETPRSVIIIDWRIFSEDFMKNLGAKITLYPKKKEEPAKEETTNTRMGKCHKTWNILSPVPCYTIKAGYTRLLH